MVDITQRATLSFEYLHLFPTRRLTYLIMQGPSMDEYVHWWTLLPVPSRFVDQWNASSMDLIHGCPSSIHGTSPPSREFWTVGRMAGSTGACAHPWINLASMEKAPPIHGSHSPTVRVQHIHLLEDG